MKARSVYLLLGVVLLGVMGVFGLNQLSDEFYEYQGSMIEPAMDAYDIVLSYESGEFRLSDFKGKIVLIFFGYTNCPDFCPTTLVEFNRVYEELGDAREDVEFVFITVDPERDTSDKVADYVNAFNPTFYGLSGAPESLAPIYEGYFVYSEIVDDGSAGGYTVDHSTRTIVIDKSGNFRMTFPYGIGVEAITKDLLHLIKED